MGQRLSQWWRDRSNCWWWAIPRWAKNYQRGEALVIRRSSEHWAPHMMRAPCIAGLQIEEYTSITKPTGWRKKFPIHALFYKGRVNKGAAKCVCESCRAKG